MALRARLKLRPLDAASRFRKVVAASPDQRLAGFGGLAVGGLARGRGRGRPQVVPQERIPVDTETVTSQQEVGADLRKEQVEVEVEGAKSPRQRPAPAATGYRAIHFEVAGGDAQHPGHLRFAHHHTVSPSRTKGPPWSVL